MKTETPRQVTVLTKNGEFDVPASPVIEEIPHFAVTMTNFPIFEVTHVPSGYQIIGGFERAANAYLAMAQIHLALKELGVNSNCDKDKLKDQIKENNTHCVVLGGLEFMTWLTHSKGALKIAGEFPWEDDETNPHEQFESYLQQISVKENV